MKEGRWQNKTRWQHMGFSPHNQGLTSPTPYPLEPCPFHSTLHCCSWLWFILIDMRVYMMPTIMCRIARYTIRNYPYCRNIDNQINGGDFSLSSSPWLITFYTSCKRGQNRGVTTILGGEDGHVPIPIGLLVDNVHPTTSSLGCLRIIKP